MKFRSSNIIFARVQAAIALLLFATSAGAATTINAANKFSWSANTGYMNWRGGGANGVVIGRYVCAGFIYGANTGWISLGDGSAANGIQYSNTSAGDFGVNTIADAEVPSALLLRGYAFGANVGWITFANVGNPRVVLSNGRLRGYAYGANIGWINLDDLNVHVQTDTIDPGADTDGDGLTDAWELSYFGTLARNGSGDPDSDGEDNLSEFRAGTNPTDGTSVFRSGRALNISTRLQVLTGDDVLIGGFIISGDTSKKVIIRGLGPSLVAQGVSGALPDPKLEVFDSDGHVVAVNNNWKETQQVAIEATTIPPEHDRESAIVRTLAPGAYTAVLTGVGNTTGIALVEVYDLTASEPVRLANISTRGLIDTGENVMIAGFIVGGGLGTDGHGSARFLVRGLGPSLAAAGVAGPLSDPTLQIYNGNGDGVAMNNDWRETQQPEIEATGIPPQNNREAAFVGTFRAGGYTAVLRGVNNGTGVGLIEVYNLP